MSLVKFEQPRFVNARDAGGAWPNVVGPHHDVHHDFRTGVDFHFLSQGSTDNHLPRSCRTGKVAPEQARLNSACHGGAVQPSNDHTLQGFRGFHDACPLMAQGHMGDTFDGAQGVEHSGSPSQPSGAGVTLRHLNMAVKSDHKLFDLVLKALNHRRRHDHQRHPQGDSRRCDAHHRA